MANKAVSFEDALRNLASALTGEPAGTLPRTQEGIVQYMADKLPQILERAGGSHEPPPAKKKG